jgi:hypothetical protein
MSARYTMTATVLPQISSDGTVATGNGTYETYQDEDSGEIKTRWVPDSVTKPSTAPASFDIPCYARGYTDLGFRSSANREVILKGDYTAFEAVEFTFPAKFSQLTRQSFITDIRDTRSQQQLYVEEETGKPTVFQVQGFTPVFDPFGKQIAWTGVINRSEVQ